jgi:hypothetical protein
MHARTTLAILTAAVLTVGCEDDKVRFGPPGGLRIRGGAQAGLACPLPAGVSPTPTPAECAAVSWANDVFPLFDATGPYLCALGGCHDGPNDINGVNMVSGNEELSYQALAAFTNGGRPYVSPNVDDNPYLICNIDPMTTEPYGTPMPDLSMVVTPADLALIGTWAACGMVNDDGAGSGAGGALPMGGNGGIGGAGGVGGQ